LTLCITQKGDLLLESSSVAEGHTWRGQLPFSRYLTLKSGLIFLNKKKMIFSSRNRGLTGSDLSPVFLRPVQVGVPTSGQGGRGGRSGRFFFFEPEPGIKKSSTASTHVHSCPLRPLMSTASILSAAIRL
jgi:hypothetical protein